MEQAAYWALVQPHLPALTEHARKITYYVLRNSRPGSIYTAEDLLHDTLIKVGKSATSQAAQPDPDWLIKVCKVAMRHIAYDLLRLADSQHTRTIEGEVGGGGVGEYDASYDNGEPSARHQRLLTGTGLSPLELLEKQDEDHALEEAFHALHRKSPDQALVVLYSLDVEDNYTLQGNSHCNKAKELGISHTSYRQKLFQGMKTLRAVLNP